MSVLSSFYAAAQSTTKWLKRNIAPVFRAALRMPHWLASAGYARRAAFTAAALAITTPLIIASLTQTAQARSYKHYHHSVVSADDQETERLNMAELARDGGTLPSAVQTAPTYSGNPASNGNYGYDKRYNAGGRNAPANSYDPAQNVSAETRIWTDYLAQLEAYKVKNQNLPSFPEAKYTELVKLAKSHIPGNPVNLDPWKGESKEPVAAAPAAGPAQRIAYIDPTPRAVANPSAPTLALASTPALAASRSITVSPANWDELRDALVQYNPRPGNMTEAQWKTQLGDMLATIIHQGGDNDAQAVTFGRVTYELEGLKKYAAQRMLGGEGATVDQALQYSSSNPQAARLLSELKQDQIAAAPTNGTPAPEVLPQPAPKTPKALAQGLKKQIDALGGKGQQGAELKQQLNQIRADVYQQRQKRLARLAAKKNAPAPA